MVGADLANLVNEAALLAARRGREAVSAPDLADALEKIVLGAERKVMMSDDDRRRTAYHEAGHALVGMLTPGADRVRKVSIIPRGSALGVTFSSPDADRFTYTTEDLAAYMVEVKRYDLGNDYAAQYHRGVSKTTKDDVLRAARKYIDLKNLTLVGVGPVDKDGKVKVEIDTAMAKMMHGDTDHEYTITAEVTDQSRRTIVGTGNVMVARKRATHFAGSQ